MRAAPTGRGFKRVAALAATATAFASTAGVDERPPASAQPRPHDAGTIQPPVRPARRTSPPLPPEALTRNGFVSVQVNVDAAGNNVVGDAANEPSLAVDPTNPNRCVIGWRQFDSVESSFREAGFGWSDDGGRSWTFGGVLVEDSFRTDPVIDVDVDGNFYYHSLVGEAFNQCDVSKSQDAGHSWLPPVYAFGGDKNWMMVDRSPSLGRGHVYCIWREDFSCCGTATFARSTDGAASLEPPLDVPSSPAWGTMATTADGTLYIAGVRLSNFTQFRVVRSDNARDAAQTPAFSTPVAVSLGGRFRFPGGGPNPGGALGQIWIAADSSGGATDGNLYVLCSVRPTSGGDPLDVHFVRSEDGGQTWSEPIRVNDDAAGTNAYQWFGTLAVAPGGRIDVVWNDTGVDATPSTPTLSEVRYSSSIDGGRTWTPSIAVTPAFDHFLGYPQQNKLGDYYQLVSDDVGTSLAYAATFNGEQDIYFLRIGAYDCNGNGVGDDEDIAGGVSFDQNADGVPDECQCLGDLDGDRVVGADDLELLLAAYGSCDGQGGFAPQADLDGDGCVALADLSIVLTGFETTCP